MDKISREALTDMEQSLALSAASQATEATGELLRFAREGYASKNRFEGDVLEQILDAAKLVMEIEGDLDDERGQVYGAICNFLEGWAA